MRPPSFSSWARGDHERMHRRPRHARPHGTHVNNAGQAFSCVLPIAGPRPAGGSMFLEFFDGRADPKRRSDQAPGSLDGRIGMSSSHSGGGEDRQAGPGAGSGDRVRPEVPGRSAVVGRGSERRDPHHVDKNGIEAATPLAPRALAAVQAAPRVPGSPWLLPAEDAGAAPRHGRRPASRRSRPWGCGNRKRESPNTA